LILKELNKLLKCVVENVSMRACVWYIKNARRRIMQVSKYTGLMGMASINRTD